MANRLATAAAERLYESFLADLRSFLEYVNDAVFDAANNALREPRSLVSSATADATGEALLNDLYVLDKYLTLFCHYGRTWQLILAGEFAPSWGALQDAIDSLRLVKRFSAIDVTFFEDQLVELEGCYPYKVFASIGAVVDRFECGLCGLDIDGLDCIHRRGELYSGKLAYGIARDVVKLDHVSLVLDPDDKRCVVEIPSDPQHFPILDFIRQSHAAGEFTIAGFRKLEWSKRTTPNSAYRKLGRNEPCFCGSGKKFKACCIGKTTGIQDHVDLVGGPMDIAGAIV